MYVTPYVACEKTDEALQVWDDVCASLQISHFLVLGICLGFVRDGGYVKGDHDVDVGVLCDKNDLEKLTCKLTEKGFVALNHLAKNGSYIQFDVIFDFPSVDHKFLKVFGRVTYKGRVYKVPHPVEAYLKMHYDNWHVPCGEPSRIVVKWLKFYKVVKLGYHVS